MFLKDQPPAKKPVESPSSDSDELHNPDPVESDELPEIDPENMEGEGYNMCHFWSNFEIARLDFFRSKEYEDFFNMMDHSGGFWAERVSPLPRFFLLQTIHPSTQTLILIFSGEMLPYIRLEQESF